MKNKVSLKQGKVRFSVVLSIILFVIGLPWAIIAIKGSESPWGPIFIFFPIVTAIIGWIVGFIIELIISKHK